MVSNKYLNIDSTFQNMAKFTCLLNGSVMAIGMQMAHNANGMPKISQFIFFKNQILLGSAYSHKEIIQKP